MGKKLINFGIIGAGNIGSKFAKGLESVNGGRLLAVASRSLAKAEEFAKKFKLEKAYGSYEELAKDDDIDVIYIASPNYYHKDHAVLCMENKKAVICEKPLAANKDHAEQMIKAARDNNVFLMEAMWIRYFPIMKKVNEWLDQDIIGRVKMVKGDFGFSSDMGYDNIRFNKELAGGSLMDVGVYPISLASMVYKKQPENIKAFANIGKTGVDELASMIFSYDQGEMAMLSSSINTQTPHNAFIIGEKGYIHLPNVWYCEQAILKLNGKEEQVIDMPMTGNGYNYEAEEVVNCLRAGKLESDLMPLTESLKIMETLDKVRKKF